MKMLHKFILGLGLLLPLIAAAQWQWLDKDGRKVFSDRPPPADVPAKNILKQPGHKTGTTKPAAETSELPTGAASSANAKGSGGKAPAASAPLITGKDKELEEKKKKAEAEIEAKKLLEAQRVAKAKAENCARAQRAKATYESGVRIARTSTSGEREILDDAARATELKRFEDVIRKDCVD